MEKDLLNVIVFLIKWIDKEMYENLKNPKTLEYQNYDLEYKRECEEVSEILKKYKLI